MILIPRHRRPAPISRRKFFRSAGAALAAPAIIKATSLGEALAQSSLPATSTVSVSTSAPAQAAGFGLNTLAFLDDFNTGTVVNGTLTSGTTTIDLGETNTPGWNWYTKPQSFPNGADVPSGGGNGGWGLNPTMPYDPGFGVTPSKIDVSNSVMSFTGGTLCTICGAYTMANPTAWHGWVLDGSAGWYVEIYFQFPNGPWTASDGAFPAFFSYMLEFYDGALGPVSSHWFEVDNFEQIGGVCEFNHDHLMVAGNNTSEASGYPKSSSGSADFNFGTNYNLHGTLYIPSTLNAGTGLLARYWNNVQISSQFFSWPSGGDYDESKNGHQLHFLTACNDDSPGQPYGPFNVDWIRIWTASPSSIVRS